MKVTELREKNVKELRHLLLSQAKEQFKMRMKKGTGEAPKSQLIKSVRRNIARILTIINQKERQA